MTETKLATSFSDVLVAAGVKKIIWIDDKFGPTAKTAPIDAVERIGTARSESITATNPLLIRLLDKDAVADNEIMGVLEAASEVERDAALGELETLLAPTPSSPPKTEYTSAEFDSVLEALGGAVSKYGYQDWLKKKDAIISEITAETLCLVDRQMTDDDANVGDDIVTSLAMLSTKPRAVLLTHSLEPAQTKRARDEIAVAKGLKRHLFAVMSKRDAKAGSVVPHLVESFRDLFLHQSSFELVQALAAFLKEAVYKIEAELLDESVYAIERVLFDNSFDEGAMELDVLLRLILFRQRVMYEMTCAKDTAILGLISKLRGFRKLAPPSAESAESPRLVEWRKAETFVDGATINGQFAPLTSGDIFRATGSGKYWVLLGQPCDLAVRGNGKRLVNCAYLFPLGPKGEIVVDQEEVRLDDPEFRYYLRDGIVGEGEWFVKFNGWAPVQLSALELCAFNEKGELVITSSTAVQPLMLPGWEARLKLAVDKVVNAWKKVAKEKSGWEQRKLDPRNSPVGLASLSASESLGEKEGAWDAEGRWSFNYVRVGRLRADLAAAAFAAFMSVHTRAAFDHDFAKGLTRVREVPASESAVKPVE